MYNTLTHPDTMRVLLANFFQDSKTQAVNLLQQSGVNISNSAPMQAVRVAWLQAIKDSASFRTSAAAVLTQYIYSKSANPTNAPVAPGTSNFVGEPFYNMLDHPSAIRYLNDSGDDSSDGSGIDLGSLSTTPTFGGVTSPPADTSGATDTGDGSYAPVAALQPVGLASVTDMTYVDPAAALGANQIKVVNTAPGAGGISGPIDVAATTGAAAPSGAVAPAASAASSGSFWSSLGSIFTPATVQAGVTTGLGAYSTQLTAAANQSAAQSALQLEAEKLQAAALAANQGFFTTPVIIGLVCLAVIGVVVAIAVRGKNKASGSASAAASSSQTPVKEMKVA